MHTQSFRKTADHPTLDRTLDATLGYGPSPETYLHPSNRVEIQSAGISVSRALHAKLDSLPHTFTQVPSDDTRVRKCDTSLNLRFSRRTSPEFRKPQTASQLRRQGLAAGDQEPFSRATNTRVQDSSRLSGGTSSQHWYLATFQPNPVNRRAIWSNSSPTTSTLTQS